MHAIEPTPASPRLSYRRLCAELAEDLYRLARDAHVRRYLLDGALVSRAWADDVVRASDALFESYGAGLWLVSEQRAPEVAAGFCGFHVFPEVEDEPQLLYALREEHTGRGYATEMGRALLDVAFDVLGHLVVHSAVDEPNVASVRVLEKLGFTPRGSVAGAFGRIVLFEMRAPQRHPPR